MLFYEIKVAYERQTGEDNPAKAKETYLLDGVNCADVEGRLLEEIQPYVSMGSDVEVTCCRKAQYYDLIPSPDGDRWYKGRVEMITVEDNGKETRKTVSILVQAKDIEQAFKNLKHALGAVDCEIVGLQRSPILEVYRAVK
ncbi:MAG: DUF4494 domain-containing protein [Bacteroidales bacterium]|nr:DUF4494 domain-containing protein [Bacteroidales bacterium]